MTNYFEWCKKAWLNFWANEEDLQIWLAKGKITQEEYNEIVQIDRGEA